MADFESIRRSLEDVKTDFKDIGLEMQKTDKYASGFRKTMSDLASMKTGKVGGTIWSAFGRLSAGIPGIYKVQNQLRSITVFFRLFENLETTRNERIEEQNALIKEQLSGTDNIVKNYKKIESLLNTINPNLETGTKEEKEAAIALSERVESMTKLSLMSDEFSRYKIKEIGMEEYLLQMQKSSVKNVADRLLTERKVIQELGEGYKLTEKNSKIIESTFGKTAGLGRLLAGTGKFTDAFKDVGKDLFGAGGPLQQLFDPTFFETKEISQQFLALKEEVEIFTGMLNDENTELEKQQKKKEKLEKKIKNLEDSELKRKINKERLREERKNLSAESGEDADYLQSLGDVTEITVELEAAKKRLHELDIEFSQTSSRNFSDNPEFGIIQAEMREERNTLMAKDFELQEKLNFIEQRKLQATEAGLQTSEELAARKQEIDEGLNKIISREIKDKEKKIELQKQLDEMDFKTQEELIASITEQKELRETEKGFLEESLAERGVKYDEGKEALSFPTGVLGKLKSKKDAFGKLKKGEQAKEIIKKLGLPLTGLFATVKGAFMAYMTKKNFNKIFRMAGLSIKVFAQILYAITLIGLLVFILHKSGFIDGVRAFVEKYQEEITNYFNILYMFFTGLFKFIKGAAKILYGLFTGNNKTIGDGLNDLVEGLTEVIMGAIGGIIGFFGGIFLVTMHGIIEGVGGKIIGALSKTAENVGGLVGKGTGMLTGGLAGAKLGAAIGTMIAPGIGTAIGGVIGGVGGAALGGSAGTSLGNVAGEKMGLKGYASGGIVSNTGLALVGEKGPELVNLPAGARVFNNNQSKSMMGSTAINVHVNGRLGASDTELDDIARKIGRKINLEMNRYNNSGYRA